ncbi:low affinity iron permease family protein [bacterium]|nr:low affinity iron permease family protein [bacterium]QQR58474.1 MAG: low affinity iron permease family protein [Candidatus Melainabacteria bacterium]
MKWFTSFSNRAAKAVGHPAAFMVALSVVIFWSLSGPLFGYSDTWQLVINTGTTIVTFLMVFLIQNTQNRDTEAIHLKLDELIRSHRPAKNSYISLEDLSIEEMDKLKEAFDKVKRDCKDIEEVEEVADENVKKIEAEKRKRKAS